MTIRKCIWLRESHWCCAFLGCHEGRVTELGTLDHGVSQDSLLSYSLRCEPEELKIHSPSSPGPDTLPRSSTTMREEPMNSTNIYDANEDYFGLANSSDYSLDVDSFLCSLQEVRKFSGLFVPLAYSLICVSGLLGNILVVVTFAFYKKAKSMTDVYLLNMAVADILFVLTLPFWAVNHATGEWIFSNVMCKLTRGIYAINFNCGMLLLTCISLDRYIAIVQATKSFRLRSRALAHHRMICLVVWVVSIFISSSTFMFNQKYKLQGSDVCEPRYHTVSEPIRWKLLVLGLQLLFGFFIPLVFMIFCYMFIVKTLIQAQNSKRHRAIRVIIAVVLVFLACQIPHNMVLLVTAVNLGRTDRSCSSERLLGYTRNVTEVLAFLHCCLNPVLYAFVGQKFRSYFLKITKDLWCVKRRQKSLGFSCSRLHSDTLTSRQNSETADNDSPSSFTM
ncbi:C-C chemokine receptor type 6 [Globicephala melas]|nr:C-C chemokine receptor type 6 [Globicephala melas]